jgi:hypothetical protein
MWDGGNDDSWLLYPGRRTRESTVDDFVETPHDSCEVIETSPWERYLCAHVDAVTLLNGDGTGTEELLNKWMIGGPTAHSTLDRKIRLLMSTNGEAARVEGNNAAVNCSRMSKFTGVDNEDAVGVVVPLIFRGDLCAALTLAIDGEFVRDPANASMILRQAVVARQKLKWLSWKVSFSQERAFLHEGIRPDGCAISSSLILPVCSGSNHSFYKQPPDAKFRAADIHNSIWVCSRPSRSVS